MNMDNKNKNIVTYGLRFFSFIVDKKPKTKNQ